MAYRDKEMIELTQCEFTGVLPLLAGIKQKVLPYAICEGINPGRVYVDHVENPQTALVWSPVGYYILAGEPVPGMDFMELSRVLTDIFVPASQASGESGFILIVSSETWKAHLPDLLPQRDVIEIYRRPFTFDPTLFAAQGNWRERIPDGFHIERMDAELSERAGVLASWACVADFQTYGLGFALLKGDEIASTCMSVFACREMLEIDVHTAENYRRRGFALLTCSALIEACLQQGKRPNWECFWENEPSTALAEKLGFIAQPDYPVYFWEEGGNTGNQSG